MESNHSSGLRRGCKTIEDIASAHIEEEAHKLASRIIILELAFLTLTKVLSVIPQELLAEIQAVLEA